MMKYKAIGRVVLPALLIVFQSCENPAQQKEQPGDIQLTILYTNDEHGWIEASASADGAAKMMGVWSDVDGYLRDDDTYLILSGGDNWTGPAISTWFQGESTLEVMNAMGYDAAAVGNHEFDFDVSGLQNRINQANFPYLSANTRLKDSGEIPAFLLPYVILEIEDLKVGIIGLTTTTASYSTFPAYVEDFDFIPYADALQDYVPAMWAEGADLILCIAHICYNEMLALAPTAEDLGVSMVGGGHCNQLVEEVYNESVALVQGGWQFAHYGKVQISYSYESSSITSLKVITVANAGGIEDPEIASIVSAWQQATELELGELIGFAEDEIPRYSAQMHNLVTDSWLAAFPQAAIAVTNAGGIRQPIAMGDITKGDIVGVLPFDNNIIELKLTGSEVIDCIGTNLILAGMTTVDGYRHMDGTPLEMDSVYSVLTTDYLYIQDGTNFHLYDDNPYLTGLNYHQPTVDYIKSLNTSASNPLNGYLDYTPRR